MEGVFLRDTEYVLHVCLYGVRGEFVYACLTGHNGRTCLREGWQECPCRPWQCLYGFLRRDIVG